MEMEGTFAPSQVERELFSIADSKRLPIAGGFELTPYCNLACKMCYVRECAPGLDVLSGEEWLSLGRQAQEMGTMCILLTGGEPLLHPQFREIYTGLKRMGMVLTINTNGTLIDEEMADFLAADMPRRVNLSLYGPNEAVYQQLCGDGKAFGRTIHAIELLLARHIPVKINLTVNTINFPYLPQILEICRNYGLDAEMSAYMVDAVRKSTPEKQRYRLSPEQIAQAYALRDRYRMNDQNFFARRALCYEMLAQFEKSIDVQGTAAIPCRSGISIFWICWNGKMNGCANMIRPQADVRKIGFAAAWEQVKAETDRIRIPQRCSQCSLALVCHYCAAIGMHENGVFDCVPAGLCQSTQAYAALMARGIQKRERKETSEERP